MWIFRTAFQIYFKIDETIYSKLFGGKKKKPLKLPLIWRSNLVKNSRLILLLYGVRKFRTTKHTNSLLINSTFVRNSSMRRNNEKLGVCVPFFITIISVWIETIATYFMAKYPTHKKSTRYLICLNMSYMHNVWDFAFFAFATEFREIRTMYVVHEVYVFFHFFNQILSRSNIGYVYMSLKVKAGKI